jgi:predicted DNA binding protein
MWIARFKLKDSEEDDLLCSLCIKHKIKIHAYPLNKFERNDKIHLLGSVILSGTEKDKNAFINSLKVDKRVISYEQYKDFVFVHLFVPASRELKKEIKIFYDPIFIKVNPIIIDETGWEFWEIACPFREDLNNLVKTAIKNYQGKLISMKKEKIKHISFLQLSPNLTEKQLESLKFAYENGYYSFPRKHSLIELSRFFGKSYSAFQENLKRAENKVIDFFCKYL